LPDLEIIKDIIYRTFNENVPIAERFPTGNCHFVFDVITESRRNVVVRIAKPENRNFLESAVFWNKLLYQKGVPVPEILAADLTSTDFPYIILERLKGKDLGLIYPQLSKFEKQSLARELAKIQRLVATLPRANSFGFLGNYETISFCRTWTGVLQNSLERSRGRIKSGGIFQTAAVDRVEEKLSKYEGYFSQIEPVAFLDDITTKNVIVNDGKLSGVVDTDWVCFGDSLFTIALTRMSLLLSNYETDYIEFWCNEANLNAERRRVLDYYTAIFCVDFMGEIGQVFNKEKPLVMDNKKTQRLRTILGNLLASI
jgi:aminoglycoside phosphotransferase (APT) family kinase protein